MVLHFSCSSRKFKGRASSGNFDFVKSVRTTAIVIFILAAITLNPFIIVPAGHRGVVLNFGAVDPTEMGEGLHWRWPVYQNVIMANVQKQKEEVEAGAASKDLQVVTTVVALKVADGRLLSCYRRAIRHAGWY